MRLRHSIGGPTVNCFGRLGIDLHTTVTEQVVGRPACRLCTYDHTMTSK